MKPPPGKHWQYPPHTLEEMDKRGEIYWSPNGNPRRKVYLDDSEGVPVQDIWLEFRDAHNQNIEVTGYPTEKNPGLLTRIVRASSREGDIVLDCFSGSGTTLGVASDLGRAWIGVDSSAAAIATTLRRFAKGLEPMGDYVEKPKRRNGGIEEMPLFGPLEPAKPYREPASSLKMITDFCLLAAAPYRGELDGLLRQWRDWVEPTSGMEVAEPSPRYRLRKPSKPKQRVRP
jgi:adenine-specific DNA-methyltransferase